MYNSPIVASILLLFSVLSVVADDIVIFLKISPENSDTANLEPLVNLPGTIALFKTQRVNVYSDLNDQKSDYNPGKYDTTVWNYVLLGEGFADWNERSRYIKDVTSFSFVESHKPVGLTPFSKTSMLNRVIEGKMNSPDLIRRPMKQAVYDTSCSDLQFDYGTVFNIRMLKTRAETVRKYYTDSTVDRVFPALGIKYFYIGEMPDAENLDRLIISEYGTKDTWCEFAFSKFVQNRADRFKQSYKMMIDIVAVLV